LLRSMGDDISIQIIINRPWIPQGKKEMPSAHLRLSIGDELREISGSIFFVIPTEPTGEWSLPAGRQGIS